jgi:hypothetical protein
MADSKSMCEADYGGGLDWELPKERMQHGFGIGGDLRAGGWCTDDGERGYGYSGSSGLEAFNVPLNDEVAMKGSGPNAYGRLGWMGDHFEIGAEAEAGELSFESTDKGDPTYDRDLRGKVAVSEGVGAGLRIYSSDKDGDGNQERGFGLSLGPLSFDVSAENLWDIPLAFGGADWTRRADHDAHTALQKNPDAPNEHETVMAPLRQMQKITAALAARPGSANPAPSSVFNQARPAGILDRPRSMLEQPPPSAAEGPFDGMYDHGDAAAGVCYGDSE